jgi:hypothetical protein
MQCQTEIGTWAPESLDSLSVSATGLRHQMLSEENMQMKGRNNEQRLR